MNQITPVTAQDFAELLGNVNVSEYHVIATNNELEDLSKMKQGEYQVYSMGDHLPERTALVDACYFATIQGIGVVTQKRIKEANKKQDGCLAYIFTKT